MPILSWDESTKRKIEHGVDRGVLYPKSGSPGVCWNGLTQVTNKSNGSDPKEYYFDGVKYIGIPDLETFSATLQAYTYPDEFLECDGFSVDEDGLISDQQQRKEFGLSYRTLDLNDELEEIGYKIHLIYNALTLPSSSDYATSNELLAVTTFSWDLVTTPISVSDSNNATAHLVIDSLFTPHFGLSILESMLYGSYFTDPQLPSPQDIIAISWELREIIIVQEPNLTLLPSWAQDGDLVFSVSDNEVYSIGDESDFVRDVAVIAGTSLDLLTSDIYPGDIVYDKLSGTLYKVGV